VLASEWHIRIVDGERRRRDAESVVHGRAALRRALLLTVATTDHSGKTVTITGTDGYGMPLVETITGPNNNTVNVVRGRFPAGITVSQFLTDSDAWFLVASNKANHALTFYRRVGITLDPMATDPYTNNRIFKVRHRFSVGAWAWQGTYGSPGA
jgi:hypothetical protein